MHAYRTSALSTLLLTATLAVVAATATPAWAGDDRVDWLSFKDAELRHADHPDRPILVFCKYRFCGSCAEMEQATFSDAATIQRIERDFIPAKITLLGFGDFKFPRLERDGKPLKISTTPTLLVVRGERYRASTGFKTPEELRAFLDEALASVDGGAAEAAGGD